MEFEKTILFNLSTNSNYTQLVSGHLDKKFFDNFYNKELFEYINNYIEKYKDLPTKSVLQHEISKSSKYTEKQFEEIISQLDSVFEAKENSNVEWLVDETEKYCQLVSAENGIIECMELIKRDVKNKQDILGIMKEALNVEFNANIGIDFFDPESIAKRFKSYNDVGSYYPTGLDTFDAVLGGGLKAKTITLFLGLTHAGKSVNMINIGANQIKKGTNVAYFTLEMSEEEISQRFEANLLDVEINDIKYLDIELFKSKLQKLKEQSYGTLKIKEFPTGYGSVTDMERALDDWKIKSGFVPEVIIIDYINIMKSVRIKDAANMYQMVKSISEEIRGLATKRNVAVLSATQTNRSATEASNVGMGDTSESFGVPMSSDVYVALISTEALREERIQIWKSLKNRNTGIIDFYFPMKTQFEFSKVFDGRIDGSCMNVLENNSFMLNNNPETIKRVDALKRRLNNQPEVKMIKDKKKIVDEEKSMVKIHPKGSDFIFDEEGNDIM